ncbi:hypothetical protein [Zavarzinella formosa]|uniref:hypothetical protein n=1 Tax=Zavarzinella formosa TaxID=360055 RepID=UPI0002FA3980|nr:hypothetical protein [Zavarzinella formosa]
MNRRLFLRFGLCWAAFATASPAALRADETVKVTVIAILASDKHKEVDKRLTAFAEEVQKKNPSLTGFKFAYTTTDKLTLGVTKTFPLVENETVEVTANLSKIDEGKITITLKPPKIGQITYNCVCERYFSMATQHFTKDKEQLFIAVTGKPCPGPEKEKEKPKEPAKSK